MRINPQLMEKIKESLSSVLPITAIVLALSITIVPLTPGVLVLFLFGSFLLIVGVGMFTLGVDMSMTPMGSAIGVTMSRARHRLLPLAAAFLLGMLITVAEPDLTVLAGQVPAIPNLTLILTVAAGVGLFLVVALLRVTLKVPLSYLLVSFYLGAFVLAILRYVGFYDEAVLQETESLLLQGAGLTGLEKRKSQLDYLVKKKRFRQALRGYDELLRCLEEAQGTEAGTGKASVEKGGSAKKEFLAKIWHNKGVAYAGLMLYKKAAECFRLALDWDGGEEYLLDYLAAKRMELSEEAYVAFTSEHGEWYPGTLELEKKLERVMGEWEQQPDYLRLCNRKDIKSRDRRRFYEDNRRLTQALKESYRME